MKGDEDQRTKNIVRYTFGLKGYNNVVGASKGADATQKVKEIRSDIMLMDIYLPDKSG